MIWESDSVLIVGLKLDLAALEPGVLRGLGEVATFTVGKENKILLLIPVVLIFDAARNDERNYFLQKSVSYNIKLVRLHEYDWSNNSIENYFFLCYQQCCIVTNKAKNYFISNYSINCIHVNVLSIRQNIAVNNISGKFFGKDLSVHSCWSKNKLNE